MGEDTPQTPRQRGRRPDRVTVNIRLDREEYDILKHFCPDGRRGTGRFLGQLLIEHRARVEERERLRLEGQRPLAEEESS